MSIVNLQRDGFWVPSAHSQNVQWGDQQAVNTTSLDVNADATVYEDAAKVWAMSAHTITAGQWRGIGAYIKQPVIDNVPYRVKAYADQDLRPLLIVAIAPATITGSDDHVTPLIVCPFDDGKVDELFMVPVIPTFEDRALCFAIAATQSSANEEIAALSVQRLATAPPTMAQSVS